MEPNEIAAALDRLAPSLAEGGTRATDLRRLSGGASQETWAFEVEDGAGQRTPLILRRRPGVATTSSGQTLALALEAGAIAAAGRQGAPVPAVVHVCAPEDGIGEGFVMARVEGETLGRRIVRDAAFAGVRETLAHRCGEVLARIHAIPMAELPGLASVDALEEIERYETTYCTVGRERPVFELALRRLKAEAPPLACPVVTHGDFRNGNLMVHPEHGLAAVLDWELAHVGDPASDLGWLCVNSWRFGGGDPVGGFGAYQDLLDGYAAGGGAPITLEAVQYWEMLGSWKWGVMCMTMYASYASGADPSVERAMIGRRVSETEIDLLNLLKGRP